LERQISHLGAPMGEQLALQPEQGIFREMFPGWSCWGIGPLRNREDDGSDVGLKIQISSAGVFPPKARKDGRGVTSPRRASTGVRV
jgi:hypothetical protein